MVRPYFRMGPKDHRQFYNNNNESHLSQTDVDNDLIGDPCDTNKDRYCVTSSVTLHVCIYVRVLQTSTFVPVNISLVQ